MALIAECTLQSISPYSSSRYYTTPDKLPKESPDAYEKRTWRERLHYDEHGIVFIPNMAFKWMLTDISKFLGMKITGKGRSTYSKHFEAGILVLEGMPLGVKKDDIPGEDIFVPADGKHGSGSRVMKTFPVVKEWKGTIVVHVLDRVITREVFEEHLAEGGRFVGLGRWRPQSGGTYGRFKTVKVKWSED
jgi:hypothetical protein